MHNPITAIKQLYALQSHDTALDRAMIEQNEQALGVQFPAMLYHYLLELGNEPRLNSSYHQLLLLPLERLGDYILIGKTCDNDGVWGIHQEDFNQHNPMVRMSRNFDTFNPSEVHWFDELPLAEFLLAQAIINGVNGGLTHHAQIYDFTGDNIPSDLIDHLAAIADEIVTLRQPHERYFQVDDYSVTILVGLDDGQPTAFLVGSQQAQTFDNLMTKLSLAVVAKT